MSKSLQDILLGSVPVVGLIWIAAFLVFPGITPMSPQMTAADVASFYSDPDNATNVRYSMIVFNWFEIGMVPLYAAIAVLMQRMSHRSGPLSYVYLAATLSSACLFAAANCFWIVAAYRPDRAPEAMQLLSDLGWICFIVPTGFLIAQNLTVAFAVYLDKQVRPVFPTWVGHFNILAALAFVPAAFAATSLEGPLAWDGALSFDLRIWSFAIYNVVMFLVAWNARHRMLEEGEPA